jgi:hypothetical protein
VKKTRNFESALVCFEDGDFEDIVSAESLLKLQLEMIKNKKPVIALYDGAPSVKARCPMICFTSYDASWFLAARDMVGIHATLFMPTWTLDELIEAKNALKLDIMDHQLSKDFGQFGGVPRACFLDSLSTEHKDYESNLEQGIAKIQSFNHFLQMLANKDDPEQIPHRLFQFVPMLDKIYKCFRESIFEPISRTVVFAISEHLKAKNHTERVEMLLKLEGSSKASSFYGFLFETLVLEVLIRDKHFIIQSLEDSSTRAFDVTSDSQIEYIKKKSYAEYASKYLQIPLVSNYPSCDCWFVDTEKRLVIFLQVTSSYHHPVGYGGLEKVLLKLSQSNHDIFTYEKILLFVVPDTRWQKMSTRFTKQTIEGTETPSLPDSKKDCLFKNIFSARKESGMLVGFGEKSYKEVLEVVGVNEDVVTLQDVHSKLSEITNTKTRNLLLNFFSSISDVSVCVDLKQYVLGIPVGIS